MSVSQTTELSVLPKRAVTYLRVSTAKQARRDGEEEGYSLPAQREAWQRKAESLGAVIVGEYLDAGASAKSADRVQLQALLARLRDQPDIAYVIVHKVDRLARNMADQVAINLALTKAKAQLVSVSEAIDETPSGMLLLAIMAGVSEFYSNNLGHEARKGIHQKALRGGTPGYAPLGYLNVTDRIDGHEVKTVIVDEERAPHVTWAYQMYATGDWSISDLVDELEARGMRSRETSTLSPTPLSRSQVHRMLASPYYLGQVIHKGVAYPGKHEAIVDEQTWQRVQAIRATRRFAGDRSWKQGHYLVGSLKCGRCGQRLSFGLSRGRNGDRYGYFFCLGRSKRRTDCQLPYLPEAEVEAAVARHWGSVVLDKATIQTLRIRVEQALTLRSEESGKTVAAQRKRLQKFEQTKTKLVDAYLASAIPVDELKRRQEEIASGIADAHRQLAEATADQEVILRHLEIALELLRRCEELYRQSAPPARRLLNQAIFTKLEVDVDGVTADELTPPFAYLRQASVPQPVVAPGKRGRTRVHAVRGGEHKNPGLSWGRGSDVALLAEGVGFEPTVSCPTHAFQACRFGRSRIPPGWCTRHR
jgi:site-specific DNA recombinase